MKFQTAFDALRINRVRCLQFFLCNVCRESKQFYRPLCRWLSRLCPDSPADAGSSGYSSNVHVFVIGTDDDPRRVAGVGVEEHGVFWLRCSRPNGRATGYPLETVSSVSAGRHDGR